MKKLFFACSLLAVTTMYAPSLMAQAPAPTPTAAPGTPAQHQQLTPEQRAQKQTDMMQKNLGLSDDQVTKVKQINLTYWTQVDQIRKNNSSDPQTMHTQMKALHNKQSSDLKAVLTADQYTKLQAAQQARQPHPNATPAPAPSGN